jgi:hypothetical protein
MRRRRRAMHGRAGMAAAVAAMASSRFLSEWLAARGRPEGDELGEHHAGNTQV